MSSSLRRRQVGFDGNQEKVKGEWLLDIAWTEDYEVEEGTSKFFPGKLMCAVECESNTSTDEFFIDFAKLVHVKSSVKIFLGGLDQTTPDGANKYRQARVEQAGRYISALEPDADDAEWYIGFWPSPKSKSGTSLWDSFDKYTHLNAIHLYRYDNCQFHVI